MSVQFENFINDEAIPTNWRVISSRFDMSNWTFKQQRLKIIGEILELADEQDQYAQHGDSLSYEKLCLELADVCIAICTLMHLQGRKFLIVKGKFESGPEGWIRQLLSRDSAFLLSSVFAYATTNSIDIVGYIRKKIKYNRTRMDWK